MRSCRILLWTTGCFLALATHLSANEVEVARPTPTQIRQWIEQLNHDDFSTRENAAASLASAGPAAINSLAQGVISDNPEVAWRCGEVLERMALEGDEPTIERIVHVLNELSKRGKPGLAQIASELRSRQQAFRRERAVTELRKLGGHIGGSYEDAVAEAAAVEAVDLGGGAILGIDFAPGEAAIEEPAMELAGEDLEGKLPGVRRFLDRLGGSELEEEGSHGPGTAIPRLIAEALLPGRIGQALQNALSKTAIDAGHAFAQSLGPSEGWTSYPPLDLESEGIDFAARDQLALGFQLPPLAEEDEEIFDPFAMIEVFPGAEMAAAEEVIEADIEMLAIAPPLFVAGMMPVAGDMPQGLLWLNEEWRGGDEGLKHAKDLHDVTTLQVENADVTDAALSHIAKIPSLRYLQVRGGKFSREALRAFHRERPSVAVMAMGEGMMGVNGNHSAEKCTLDIVSPNTAAHQAGLQAGDEVIAIDDDEIRDFSELTISVSTHKPGDRLRVVYLRDGEKREAVVTLKPRNAGQ